MALETREVGDVPRVVAQERVAVGKARGPAQTVPNLGDVHEAVAGGRFIDPTVERREAERLEHAQGGDDQPGRRAAPAPAVAGGGDAALQDALLLSNRSSKVYIIHRRDEFRAAAANVSAARSRPHTAVCMSRRGAELEGAAELTVLVM